MKFETKKTVAIVGCVGAIVAVGVMLQRTPPAEGKVRAAAAKGPAPEPTCGGDGPAKATADFGRGTVSAALSNGKLMRASGGEVYAAFDLATAQAVMTERPPLNLALVIDRSGSMDGEKFAAAKQAALGFVERLDVRDHVALVQYDDTAQVAVASVAIDRAGKAKLGAAIREMAIGGGTNLHDGLVLGRDEVRRALASQSGQAQGATINRVILLSDGRASSGITGQPQIAEVARRAADQGVRITTVGLGLDYNEDLMEAIAEAGRGNYYYVKDSTGLAKVMTGELAGVQGTVATDVELRLRTPCAGVAIAEVHGYESRRDGDATIIPMADLFGNDTRKLLVQLTVPVARTGKLGALQAELRFRDATSGAMKTATIALAVEVTDDQAAAAASIDTNVMAQVMSVQAAGTMRQAAAAYDRGDVAGATELLDTATTKLEADRNHYKMSPKAAAPAFDSLREMKTATTTYMPGSDGGKNVMKSTKAKARVMAKGR